MALIFTNNSVQVKNMLRDKAVSYLYEAGGELEAQTKRNSRVGKGQLKNSWTYKVDEEDLVCTVGSPLENAIWEEFGTGEYALNGNGRKGGWYYQDQDTNKWHHTFGKTPHRAFHRAFSSLKTALIRRAREVIGGR
jgi:hypothetical protein